VVPSTNDSKMGKDRLTLKRASASRPSGEWNDDDYDVLAGGVIVGRIFNVNAAPVGRTHPVKAAGKNDQEFSL
jgi:hypothetical protein